MPQLSIWEKESFFAPQDVIIIGSGFAGLWSALKLMEKNPFQKITILERGIIPTGASTRNAGFSCFGSPSELLHDIATMGEEKTWQVVSMRYKGLHEIRKYFPDDKIGYDASGGYECFRENAADWVQSADKLDWLNERLRVITNLKNSFTIADEKLTTFGFKGFAHLIESGSEGGLHSGKFVQALLQKVQGMGVQVLTNIEVKSYELEQDMVKLITNKETNFLTKKLLLCTNAFTKHLLPELDITPNRGQVLLTNAIDDFKIRGTFHFDQGYYYFRNLDNRLLIGGARNKSFKEEETTEMATTHIIQNELEEFVREHLLPNIPFTITDRWSGIMAMGSEKLPIVKAIGDQVFCCVRMGGMGVALAPVVAEQIAAIMNQS
jgi:glycine/D-amino acid oxidase-like deaminating enzyme